MCIDTLRSNPKKRTLRVMFQYISVSTFCKKHGKDNKYYYNNQTLRQVTLRNVTFRKLYVTNRPSFRMPSLCRRRRGVLFISLVVLPRFCLQPIKTPRLLERFPTALGVTKQTTNDNITKTNLFHETFRFHVAKVRILFQTDVTQRFRNFSFCIKPLNNSTFSMFFIFLSGSTSSYHCQNRRQPA